VVNHLIIPLLPVFRSYLARNSSISFFVRNHCCPIFTAGKVPLLMWRRTVSGFRDICLAASGTDSKSGIWTIASNMYCSMVRHYPLSRVIVNAVLTYGSLGLQHNWTGPFDLGAY